MLEEIGTPDQAPGWVRDRLAAKQKIMGFGHRVYKTWDPRATVLHDIAERLGKQFGEPRLVRHLHPGPGDRHGRPRSSTPTSTSTPPRSTSPSASPDLLHPPVRRPPAWPAGPPTSAEQYADNRLIPARLRVRGPKPRSWQPIESRGRAEWYPFTHE